MIYIFKHTCIYIHTHTHTHMRTNTHTHTYTPHRLSTTSTKQTRSSTCQASSPFHKPPKKSFKGLACHHKENKQTKQTNRIRCGCHIIPVKKTTNSGHRQWLRGTSLGGRHLKRTRSKQIWTFRQNSVTQRTMRKHFRTEKYSGIWLRPCRAPGKDCQAPGIILMLVYSDLHDNWWPVSCVFSGFSVVYWHQEPLKTVTWSLNYFANWSRTFRLIVWADACMCACMYLRVMAHM